MLIIHTQGAGNPWAETRTERARRFRAVFEKRQGRRQWAEVDRAMLQACDDLDLMRAVIRTDGQRLKALRADLAASRDASAVLLFERDAALATLARVRGECDAHDPMPRGGTAPNCSPEHLQAYLRGMQTEARRVRMILDVGENE